VDVRELRAHAATIHVDVAVAALGARAHHEVRLGACAGSGEQPEGRES
jgi:hypothetical protein